MHFQSMFTTKAFCSHNYRGIDKNYHRLQKDKTEERTGLHRVRFLVKEDEP